MLYIDKPFSNIVNSEKVEWNREVNQTLIHQSTLENEKNQVKAGQY